MEYYSFEKLEIALEEECILSNININMQPESIIGIFGEKNSGKTLFVRALTSEKTYASRAIKIKNAPTYFPAILVKSNQLIEHNTAINNFRLLTAQNETLTMADIDWYLEKVGLTLNDEREVHEYTKAEKFLLAVAIVLSNHPKIIIFDAPFNEFELTETAKLYELITKLNRMNLTILITERNRVLLDPICKELYQMQANSLEKITE